jgi:hypothetical protein
MTSETIIKDKFCWYCHLKCFPEDNVVDDTIYECTECFRVFHEKCLSSSSGTEENVALESLPKPSLIRAKCDECKKVSNGQKIPQDQMEKYCKMLEYAIQWVKFSQVKFWISVYFLFLFFLINLKRIIFLLPFRVIFSCPLETL